MAHSIPRERDVEFDLESGGNTSEEDASNDLYISDGESKSGFRWAWNGALTYDGSDKRESGVESCSNSAKPGGGGGVVVDDDNLELLVEKGLEHTQEQVPHVNGNHVKQKSKPANPRKPPKPPLPPKGPSLDAGDQKYVKELAELALRKRARIKRMKAVKRMKASKSTSSSLSSYTSLSAMVITVLFFLVIILHGIRSASSTAVGLIASPELAIPADEGLISVQYPKNFVTDEGVRNLSYMSRFLYNDMIGIVNKKRSFAYGYFFSAESSSTSRLLEIVCSLFTSFSFIISLPFSLHMVHTVVGE